MARRSANICSHVSVSVQPVQVLNEQEQGLLEALAQQDLGDGVERALSLERRVHLRQGGGGLDVPQQGQHIGQGLFQAPIQRQHLAGHPLPSSLPIILRGELKVVLQQLEQR